MFINPMINLSNRDLLPESLSTSINYLEFGTLPFSNYFTIFLWDKAKIVRKLVIIILILNTTLRIGEFQFFSHFQFE